MNKPTWIIQVCQVCCFRAPHKMDSKLNCLVCSACGDHTHKKAESMTFEAYQEKLDNYWGGL